MKVHEYQAKEVLARYGVPVPNGRVAASADEAAAVAADLGAPVAVKAQIHPGGRGQGGVDIEEVAAKTPERIHRLPVDPSIGFQQYQGRELALALGLGGDLMRPAVQAMSGLYRAFVENDCSLAEINPLVVTADAPP